MTDNRTPEGRQQEKNGKIKVKKPYCKPAFRHERVFETAALSCGKIASTVFGCISSRKTS
jgi:hypothetical protein